MKKLLVIVLALFGLLAYRDFLSDRTTLANLDPFPDSLDYLMPAWNFTGGQGFVMEKKTYVSGNDLNKQEVPPMYTLWLIPFLTLFRDFRVFYIANIALALITIFLTLKISFKLTSKWWWVGLGGYFLVTNFYFFQLPTFLMAENITMTLTLVCFYIALEREFKGKNIITLLLSLALFLVKFANLPIALTFVLCRLMEMWKAKGIKRWIFDISVVIIVGLVYFKVSGILSDHKNLESGASFGFEYFSTGITFYLKTLLGFKTRWLWFEQNWWTALNIALVVIGWFFANKRIKILVGSLVILTISFLSTFYFQDGRYIQALLPPLIILGINGAANKFSLSRTKEIGLVLLIIGLDLVSPIWTKNINNFKLKIIGLKNQVGINFLYQEKPWNMEAVREWDKFAKEEDLVINYLSPLYVNLFNPTFKSVYLQDPLVTERWIRIHKGGRVLIADYLAGQNLESWQKIKDKYLSDDKSQLVFHGCEGACNLWKIKSEQE